MTHPDRPTGHHYDLPVVSIVVGDHVDRAVAMGDGWYRQQILRDELKRVRRILLELKEKKRIKWNGKRLPDGNKNAIRQIMRIVDTAYEVEVSGVVLRGMHIDNTWTDQCYVGGGSGWSGMSPYATLLFRAVLDGEQHAGVNIAQALWPGHLILEARERR